MAARLTKEGKKKAQACLSDDNLGEGEARMAFLNVAPLWTGGQSGDDTGLSRFSNRGFDSPQKHNFLALRMGFGNTRRGILRDRVTCPRGTSLSEALPVRP